ncbi:unnamed protein product [Dracunculus medinensis]|uniref:FAR1 domain-containing protein n=1 Tax=Dracunculus medinensis TaxID=318479 RepID=A0A0N4UK75_DRAME|nr:unnamed protein product [Dracunculus medinensis]
MDEEKNEKLLTNFPEGSPELIRKNQTFKSFRAFEKAFCAWQEKNFFTYRVYSSDCKKLKDGTKDPEICYNYVVYQCVHYGEPRKRGNGIRKQEYLASNCKARLRLNYDSRKKLLEISRLSYEHNHVCDKDSYLKALNRRRQQATSQHVTKKKARTQSNIICRKDHVLSNLKTQKEDLNYNREDGSSMVSPNSPMCQLNEPTMEKISSELHYR